MNELDHSSSYLPKVIFGCAHFGGFGSSVVPKGVGNSEKESFWHLDKAFELGIRWFDTAHSYSKGESEKIIGKWIKSKGEDIQEQIKVSTKIGNVFGEHPHERSLKKDAIDISLEESRMRIKKDCLDLVFSHVPDPNTPIKETVVAFLEAVDGGRIYKFGASNVDCSQVLEYKKYSRNGEFFSVQNICNWAFYEEQKDILNLCNSIGVNYWAHSPLFGGILTGKYEEDIRKSKEGRMSVLGEKYHPYISTGFTNLKNEYEQESLKLGISLTKLSYLWFRRQSNVSGIIIGPRTKQHWIEIEDVYFS